MNKIILPLALIVTLGFAFSVRADEVVVTQEKKEFSEKSVNVKVGDSIKFENKDDVTHNVYSHSKGHEFEIEKQNPGESQVIKFSKPGEVKVRCAIHPKMKMTVKVAP